MDALATHAHDAVVALSQNELDLITDGVETILDEAIEQKNPEIAFNLARQLIKKQQIGWVALAHWCYLMEQRWEYLGGQEDFLTVASMKLNKSRETLRRYLEIWKWVMEEPDHGRARLEALCQKPLQGLWYIKTAAKEGQLTEDDWEEIERAPDIASLKEIRDRVRGNYGRAKDALRIMLEPDGTLKASKGGDYVVIGLLNVHLQDNNPVIRAAIERIVRTAGVFYR